MRTGPQVERGGGGGGGGGGGKSANLVLRVLSESSVTVGDKKKAGKKLSNE